MKRASKLPHWPPALPGGWGGLRWPSLFRLLLALVTAGVLTTLAFFHLDFFQIGSSLEQFRVGQPIPRDVQATREITWQDFNETDLRRADAAARVPIAYTFDENAARNALGELERVFTALASPTPAPEDQATLEKIPQDIVLAARSQDPAALETLRATTREVVTLVMADRIEEGVGLPAAQQRIDQLAAEREQVQGEADLARNRIVSGVARLVLRPTWVRDEQRTELERRQARASVAPVINVYKRGDTILRKGTVLTQEDLQQLKDRELLMPAPLARLAPVAAIMLLAVGMLGVYLRASARPVYDNDRKLLLLAGLLVAPGWVCLTLGNEQEFLVGLIAIPAATMAIAGLLGTPLAIVGAVLISLTTALAAHHQFAFALLTLSSAFAGAMAVRGIWPASRAVPAVLGLSAVNLLFLVSITAVTPGEGFGALWPSLGRLALWAVAGGLGATFIAVGAIYILARPFGITTHYRLMELSNPMEPLLRRMMLEAPGSYHSSVMVANMAEAGADAIGANALLTRVAALYHDIGKLKRPAFFVENQAPLGIENVHQRLSPKLSYLILTSHVRDGAELAVQHNLPQEVVNIIREHHGTTLAAYFYHRALNEAGGEQVSEYDFRYPGPKPSSREAAVVMLADSVQASVKAIKEPTPSRIENMVQDIINSRLQDGQLEDCDITLRDLRRIAEVFLRILTGLYTYTRIEYPDVKRESARINVHLNSEPPTKAGDAKVPASGS